MFQKVKSVVFAKKANEAAEMMDTQREALRQVAEANNAFSADLYGKLSDRPGNLIVSPLSACAALALVLQGAGGQTAQQLQAVLHLPADAAQQREGFKALMEQLRKMTTRDSEKRNYHERWKGFTSVDDVEVRMVNKVFVKRGASVKAPFRSVAVDSFGADAEELDFADATEAARQRINRWVEGATDAKIKDLLDSLDREARMVLVNAVYFEAAWATPFYKNQTRREPFHLSRSEQVTAVMMRHSGRFSYASLPDLGARVLEMPYKELTMRMLVVLPDEVDGLARVEAGLRGLDLAHLSSELTYGAVAVTLPIVTMDSSFDLEETLPQLGINDLFTYAANLSGIADEPLWVSKMVQKASVKVFEEGTVAIAATGCQIVLMSAPHVLPNPVIFTADHPFIFLIVDSSNIILFIGRVNTP